MVLLTTVSLPGMGVADMTTVSARHDLDVPVVAVRNADEGGCRLSLAAGGHQHHLLRGQVSYLSEACHDAGGSGEISHFHRHVRVVHHAATYESNLAPMPCGRVNDLLHTRDERGECGYHNPAGSFGYHPFQGVSHNPLRRRVARHLGVRGVGAEQ